VIGKLSELYIPPSNFILAPIAAFAESLPELKLSEEEVESAFFCDLDNLSRGRVQIDKWDFNGKTVDVPNWDLGQKTRLWGATSMIIMELIILFEEFNTKFRN
jgi:hypothetical protein